MTSIQMPQLGETIIEGTILKWLKAEGETVERDEPLFEISTDKVDTEVPSPVAGTVTKILVGEGETVPVGTELAEVSTGDGAGEAAGEAPAAAADAAPASPEPTGSPRPRRTPRLHRRSRPRPRRPHGLPSRPLPAAEPERGPRSQILSPLVRKLAQEHGLDLSSIAGTGAGGRITKSDVMQAVSSGAGAATAPPAGAAPAPAHRRR